MKKILTIAAVALIFASLASCKKDYTCTCKGDEMGTLTLPIANSSNKDAEEGCDAFQVIYRNGDITVNCELQ